MNIDLAAAMRPIAEPQVIDGVYSDDQFQRLVGVMREHGPWKLILAQHFASPEELAATMSGGNDQDALLSFDDFLTPVFRGYFAEGGTALYPEIEDCFYNSNFLERVRRYWNADYARPEQLLFNLQGPAESRDPAHLDATNFRGITYQNTPVWLMNTMAKSALFNRWLNKKAQIITWFYKGRIGGGFTYWPEGPHAQPKRLAAPMWNRGVVVQNEMMYHRGEETGPTELRRPKGLAFESVIRGDPDVEDGWQIVTGDTVVQTLPADEMRFLLHWGAEIYADFDEMKLVLDHRDDLSHDQVFDIFIKDLRERNISFEVPTDPLRDVTFIKLLNAVYDLGVPLHYPVEAPGPFSLAA